MSLGDAFIAAPEQAQAPPAEPRPTPVLDETPAIGVPTAAPPAQPIVPKAAAETPVEPHRPVLDKTPVMGIPIAQPPAAPADGGIRLSRPFSGGGGAAAAPPPPAAPARPVAPVFQPTPGQPVQPTTPVPQHQPAPPAQQSPQPPAATPAPTPAAPAASEGSVTQGFKRKPINPFLSRDPTQKARRLARALISDMIVYQPEKRQKALQEGDLKDVFGEEVKKSWEEYVQQVGEELANSTPFFRDALNEILAGGQAVF